jgi:hypothetical protein
MESKFKIISPKPFQKVDVKFVLSGLVPKPWLLTEFGIDNRVFLDFIDINCLAFWCSSADVIEQKLFFGIKKRFKFETIVHFDQISASYIKTSQGRITIKISGQNKQQFFLPIIIKNTNPNFKVDPIIEKRHKQIGNLIRQYLDDIEEFNKAMKKISDRRSQKSGVNQDDEWNYRHVQDWELLGHIFEISNKAEYFSAKYPYAEEDQEEKQLEEKYRDAIEWRGSMLRGIAGCMNGFEFRVFSNDHGNHFHIIHREKGINARFSFPDIQLINYKQAINSISSKEIKNINLFFQNAENFNKLEKEFIRCKRN